MYVVKDTPTFKALASTLFTSFLGIPPTRLFLPVTSTPGMLMPGEALVPSVSALHHLPTALGEWCTLAIEASSAYAQAAGSLGKPDTKYKLANGVWVAKLDDVAGLADVCFGGSR